MNSNQQQALDTLNQPSQPSGAAITPQAAPPSHPCPPASAAPTASAAPPVTHTQVIGTAFKTLTVRGLVLGGMCGAVYGAVYGAVGVLLAPNLPVGFLVIAIPLGAIWGLIIGVIWGGLLGMIEGLFVGLVSAIRFYPLRSWHPYRKVIGALCMLLTVSLSLLVGIPWLFPIYPDVPYTYTRLLGNDAMVILFIPTLIAAVCSWFGSYRVAARYAAVMQVASVQAAPDRLSYDLKTTNIYDPVFQQALFNELQPSYRTVVDLTSLAMLNAWRRELIALMDLQPDARVCDLMSGAGQLWNHILPRLGPEGRLIGIDCAPAAVQAAQADLHKLADPRVGLRQGDALHTGLPDQSVSAVTCAFGPMLVDPLQLHRLANEIARILDDHGVVGLVDLSLPDTGPLRGPYLFYLRRFVPLAGFAFGGNHSLYHTLARFVEETDATQQLEYLLTQRGFLVYRYRLSGGCASALVGMKVGAQA